MHGLPRVLMDGTNKMTAALPSQAGFAARTLRWGDFTNQAAVNKSTITVLRVITTGHRREARAGLL